MAAAAAVFRCIFHSLHFHFSVLLFLALLRVIRFLAPLRNVCDRRCMNMTDWRVEMSMSKTEATPSSFCSFSVSWLHYSCPADHSQRSEILLTPITVAYMTSFSTTNHLGLCWVVIELQNEYTQENILYSAVRRKISAKYYNFGVKFLTAVESTI